MCTSGVISSLVCPYPRTDPKLNARRNRQPAITQAVSNIYWQFFESFYQLTYVTLLFAFIAKEIQLS
jgi:hypothetical protein